MAHIVNEKCIDCLHKNCVEVCPVNCFHLGQNMIVIDPEECIDCGVCVGSCPESAISLLEDNPPEGSQMNYWAQFNAYYAKRWPRISDIVEELPEDLSLYDVHPIDKEKCLQERMFSPLPPKKAPLN